MQLRIDVYVAPDICGGLPTDVRIYGSKHSCLVCHAQACTSLQVDIITLDLGRRLPFWLRPGPLQAAVKRGVHFEVCYAAALRDEGSRRNFFANATGECVPMMAGTFLEFEASIPEAHEERACTQRVVFEQKGTQPHLTWM